MKKTNYKTVLIKNLMVFLKLNNLNLCVCVCVSVIFFFEHYRSFRPIQISLTLS